VYLLTHEVNIFFIVKYSRREAGKEREKVRKG
jgi:hypothetical protein